MGYHQPRIYARVMLPKLWFIETNPRTPNVHVIISLVKVLTCFNLLLYSLQPLRYANTECTISLYFMYLKKKRILYNLKYISRTAATTPHSTFYCSFSCNWVPTQAPVKTPTLPHGEHCYDQTLQDGEHC